MVIQPLALLMQEQDVQQQQWTMLRSMVNVTESRVTGGSVGRAEELQHQCLVFGVMDMSAPPDSRYLVFADSCYQHNSTLHTQVSGRKLESFKWLKFGFRSLDVDVGMLGLLFPVLHNSTATRTFIIRTVTCKSMT